MLKKMVLVGISSLALVGCNDAVRKVSVPTNIEENKCSIKVVDFNYPKFKYTKGNYFTCHKAFIGEYNPITKTSVWVATKLNYDTYLKSEKTDLRVDFFRPDIYVERLDSPAKADYDTLKQKGYIEGQLLPEIFFKESQLTMSQSFYYSNIFPMVKTALPLYDQMNRYTISLLKQYKEIYVYAGVIYHNNKPLLRVGKRLNDDTKGKVKKALSVPTDFYRLIYIPSVKKSLIFIIPNYPSDNTNVLDYKTNLSTLEEKSLIKFFK